LFLLALSRGHPRLDPCPGYFPEGYGMALRLRERDLADFADITIIKLMLETDPRIRTHLGPLIAARNAYYAAAARAREDAKARDEAIALAKKERRAWGRALVGGAPPGREAALRQRLHPASSLRR
jgi:hypothetical protein